MRTQKASIKQKEFMSRLAQAMTSAIDDIITTEILSADDSTETDINLLMTALINASANSLCLLHRGAIPVGAIRLSDERFMDGVSDAFKVVMQQILKDNPATEFKSVKH